MQGKPPLMPRAEGTTVAHTGETRVSPGVHPRGAVRLTLARVRLHHEGRATLLGTFPMRRLLHPGPLVHVLAGGPRWEFTPVRERIVRSKQHPHRSGSKTPELCRHNCVCGMPWGKPGWTPPMTPAPASDGRIEFATVNVDSICKNHTTNLKTLKVKRRPHQPFLQRLLSVPPLASCKTPLPRCAEQHLQGRPEAVVPGKACGWLALGGCRSRGSSCSLPTVTRGAGTLAPGRPGESRVPICPGRHFTCVMLPM